MLNLSENSNNQALSHGGVLVAGTTSSVQSSGPSTQIRQGRQLIGGGVHHQIAINSKSNSNLGVASGQGLPYQDNMILAVGGSQGSTSFSNNHHGLMMNKVPSKLSGI